MNLDLINIFLPIIAQVSEVASSGIAEGAPTNVWGTLNLTVLGGIISGILGALVALHRIFGPKKLTDADKPCKDNLYCAQQIKELNRIETRLDADEITTEEIKSTIGELKVAIAELKKDVESSSKTIEEMKKDNRALAQRLETLLNQLVTYVGD